MDVLAVEYPGYGVYKGKANESIILEDSKLVMHYLTKEAGYNSKDLIVAGRSIGSGPAIECASQFSVKALLLISPFLSIKEVVRNFAGEFFSQLVEERFDNQQKIKSVCCPTLFIHGREDNLVPFSHS